MQCQPGVWLGQVPLRRGPALGQVSIPEDPATWRVFELEAWLNKVTTQLEVRQDCVFEMPEWEAFWKGLRDKTYFGIKTIQLARLNLTEIAYINFINECLSMEPGAWQDRYERAIDEFLDEFQAAQQQADAQQDTTTDADAEEPSDNTLLTVGGIGAAALLIAAIA